jgi:hypothetical protein
MDVADIDRNLAPDDPAPDPRPLHEAICTVVRGTFDAIGDEFLKRLVCGLAAALDVRYAFATGPVAGTPSEPARERRLGVWLARDFGLRFEFSAAGPPWRAALATPPSVDYRVILGTLFPGERRLAEIDEGSCRAVPLLTSTGRLVGHLGTLDPGPAADRAQIEGVLKTLAARAVAEIERGASAARHRRALRRLRAAAAKRRPRKQLLTACAWCRRVRDERKDWQNVEGFLRTHIGLELTHGICPDCLRRHQPGGLEPA